MNAAALPRRTYLLRFLHANIYRANRQLDTDLRFIESLDVDVAAINEGINAVPKLKLLKGFQLVVNAVRSRGGWDTPILIRTKHKLLGWSSKQVTEAVEPSKLAPARFNTAARFLANGNRKRRHKHYCVHYNAVLQNRTTGAPLLRAARVVQARLQAIALEASARAAIARGIVVTISGDFNYRDRPGTTADTDWHYSPQKMFTRLGLTWISEGLDYFAYPEDAALETKEVISTKRTGSDHPWLLLVLKFTEGRRRRFGRRKGSVVRPRGEKAAA